MFRSIDEFIDTAIATLPNLQVPAPLEQATPRTSRLWKLREGLTLGDLSIEDPMGK